MQKLHSPYIRIEISEVVERPGDPGHRETLYFLAHEEFQTKEEAFKWLKSQNSVGSFDEYLADAAGRT